MSEISVFDRVKDCHPDVIRGFIQELERTCVLEEQKLEIPIKHYFAHNLYAREMTMPAGSLVVGKIHRYENMSVLTSGEASVLSTEGLRRIKAPLTFVAPAGTKRVIFAHTELVWTTFHATGEHELEKIEAEIIAKDYGDLPENLSTKEIT